MSRRRNYGGRVRAPDDFWGRVDKSAGPDGCWPWVATIRPDGYGAVEYPGIKTKLVHRIAYWLETGEQPEAVCHRCDNPPCCNPTHLWGGTRADNNRDMHAKGRAWQQTGHVCPRGHEHGNAKLDAGLVAAIQGDGSRSQRALAREYGVSQSTIWRVLNRESVSVGP